MIFLKYVWIAAIPKQVELVICNFDIMWFVYPNSKIFQDCIVGTKFMAMLGRIGEIVRFCEWVELPRRLGKNKLHELCGVQFSKRFSAKFGSLNMQIRNTFKNIISIACKWSKICQYYVNSMVIACSTCQKKEKRMHMG